MHCTFTNASYALVFFFFCISIVPGTQWPGLPGQSPSTRSSPPCKRRRPTTHLRKVVLPQPDGPSKPNIFLCGDVGEGGEEGEGEGDEEEEERRMKNEG